MVDMKSKVALVTGGGNGIGRAACLEFARANAKVVFCDLDQEGGKKTLEEIKSLGGEGDFLKVNVAKSDEVKGYIDNALQEYGHIDAYFSNAGIEGIVSPMVDYPEEIFDKVISVNLKGTYLGLKYVLPVMVRQKSGSVITMASSASLRAYQGFSAYAASKHGVVGLTQVAAAEVGANGVRVNAICPGVVRTEMIERIEKMADPEDPESVQKQLEALSPIGRKAEVEEIARVVVFLASDDACYINGAVLPIDGGLTTVVSF